MNSDIQHLMVGLVTIRAYEKTDFFKNIFVKNLDRSCNAYFFFTVMCRMMALYLDFGCLIFTGVVAIITLTVNVSEERNA